MKLVLALFFVFFIMFLWLTLEEDRDRGKVSKFDKLLNLIKQTYRFQWPIKKIEHEDKTQTTKSQKKRPLDECPERRRKYYATKKPIQKTNDSKEGNNKKVSDDKKQQTTD